ncbi:MAG: hypothetical protein CMJ83_06685 [Planctomycetes bacterium]|nr:hypothetical protein [Planctomycetota bacterium]
MNNVAGAVLVAMLLAGIASAQSGEAAFSVTCRDTDQKPVAGAEVFVFQARKDAAGKFRYDRLGTSFKTDAKGRVQGLTPVTYDDGRFDRWFVARVPGRLIGFGRSARFPALPSDEVKPASVLMSESHAVTGQVNVPEGFDVTKVRVRALSVDGPQGRGTGFPRGGGSFPGLETALPQIFERTPNAKGEFTFDDVAIGGRLCLAAEGPGLAQAQYSNLRDPEYAVFALDMVPEAVLVGAVTTPDPKLREGLIVTARLTYGRERPTPYLYTFRTRTDAKGGFRLTGLPQTRFTVRIEKPPSDFVMMPRLVEVLRHRVPQSIDIDLETGFKVSGIVRDVDTDKPLQHANISAITNFEPHAGIASSRTGVDGRFTLVLPPGECRLYFSSVPRGYEYPMPQRQWGITVEESFDDLEFTLTKK